MNGGRGRIAIKEVLSFSVLLFATFFILIVLRSLDDNRLTNWQYAFTFADPQKAAILLTTGILAAFILTKSSFPDRHPSLFLFVFSYAVASVFWREPELIVDASRYFTEAKHLELYGFGYFLREWGKAIPVWTDMPAVPFLYGIIFRFFGESRLFIEIFNTLLFSLTVVLTYLTGRKLWGKETGLFGGLFLLGIPYLFSQVPLMLVDLPSTFFLMLSVFLFLLALERGGPIIFAASLAIFVTFFAKYSTWLMLSVLAVILVVRCLEHPSHSLKRYLFRGALIFLSAGILIGMFAAYKYDVISGQMRLLIEYQKPGLRRWGESFISTFFFQIFPWLTIAAACSIYRAVRKKDLRFLIILWLPIVVLSLRIERIRYIVMVFPMLGLAASYGLMQVRKRETAKFIALLVAISSVVIAVSVYLPFLDRISLVNIESAGAFLDSLNGDSSEIFTRMEEHPVVNPAVAVPILDLFTKKKIRYAYSSEFPMQSREILESPLRFTFEYRNPRYYSEAPAGRVSSVVVIAGEPGEALPAGIAEKTRAFRRAKVFDTSENVFDYKTFITVYY